MTLRGSRGDGSSPTSSEVRILRWKIASDSSIAKVSRWAWKTRKKKVANQQCPGIMKLWNRKFRYTANHIFFWSAHCGVVVVVVAHHPRCGSSGWWADSIYYFSALCGFAIVLINYGPATMGKFIGCPMGRRRVCELIWRWNRRLRRCGYSHHGRN